MHIPVSPPAVARRTAGFSLVELMVVLAIGAVLTSVAAPSFRSTLIKYRIGAENATLLDSLLLARNEARNSTNAVTVCTSNNGTSCTASTWAEGHIVFRDGGTAGAVDGTDSVILRGAAAKTGITTTAKLQQNGSAFTAGYLQFTGTGSLSIRTAVVFSTCQTGYTPLLTAVQFNGSTSSSKGTVAC